MTGFRWFFNTLGSLRFGDAQARLWNTTCVRCVGLFCYNYDGTAYRPDMAKSFKFSPDMKTLTIELREGHKWSDGAPFTTDDIMYWWEDVANNTDISPAGPGAVYMPGGKVMEVKKVSPTVIEFHFAVPWPVIMDRWGAVGSHQIP